MSTWTLTQNSVLPLPVWTLPLVACSVWLMCHQCYPCCFGPFILGDAPLLVLISLQACQGLESPQAVPVPMGSPTPELMFPNSIPAGRIPALGIWILGHRMVVLRLVWHSCHGHSSSCSKKFLLSRAP